MIDQRKLRAALAASNLQVADGPEPDQVTLRWEERIDCGGCAPAAGTAESLTLSRSEWMRRRQRG